MSIKREDDSIILGPFEGTPIIKGRARAYYGRC